MFNLVLFHSEGPPHDKAYKLGRYINIILNSAKPNVDNVRTYTPRILRKMGYEEFVKEYPSCGLANRNSGINNIGFCAWKPLILKLELDKVNDGDVVVYRDCNCRKYGELANYNNFRELCLKFLELCGTDFFMPIQNNKYKLRQFVKTNVIKDLAINYEYSLDFPLTLAGLIIIKKSEFSTQILEEWLEKCKIPEYINGEQYGDLDPQFKWYTPEQGILGVIISNYVYKNIIPIPKIITIRDLNKHSIC
jgi:hypothetical protein